MQYGKSCLLKCHSLLLHSLAISPGKVLQIQENYHNVQEKKLIGWQVCTTQKAAFTNSLQGHRKRYCQYGFGHTTFFATFFVGGLHNNHDLWSSLLPRSSALTAWDTERMVPSLLVGATIEHTIIRLHKPCLLLD